MTNKSDVEETSKKCFIILTYDRLITVSNVTYDRLITVSNVRLIRELCNVRYANNSPVCHSISSFDRALEMDNRGEKPDIGWSDTILW